jgi:hypothetical protein
LLSFLLCERVKQLPTLSDLLSKPYASLTDRDKNRMRKLDRKAKLKGSNDLLEQ